MVHALQAGGEHLPSFDLNDLSSQIQKSGKQLSKLQADNLRLGKMLKLAAKQQQQHKQSNRNDRQSPTSEAAGEVITTTVGILV